MTTFDAENAEIKFAIAEAAVDLYVQQGEFYIKEVAEATDIKPAEVFKYFPNKQAILRYYYTMLVYRYRMMIEEIEQFNHYTLSEKFSNFIYSYFDMLAEKKSFIQDTFKILILFSCKKTVFEQEIEYLFEEFLEQDEQLAASTEIIKTDLFYQFLKHKYLNLVLFWLSDDSDDHELSMQLTDKLTGFLQELMYNTIADRGIELTKFIYANRKEFIGSIPVVKKLFSKIEVQ